MTSTPPPVTVIGIGNPYRRDDGAAATVLARLAELLYDRLGPSWGSTVRLVELDGESVRLVQAWEGSHHVWIVDAVRSGRPPGTVHEVDATRLDELDDTGRRLGGGHLMGLGEAVELARVLGRLPQQLHVLGIEGVDFDNGLGLTPEVTAAVETAAQLLADAVAPTSPN